MEQHVGVIREVLASRLAGAIRSCRWCGVLALLSFTSVARADPRLQAVLSWHGSCDDAEDLVQQVRARGAELELRQPSASAEAEAAHAVRVEVMVKQPVPSALSAQIHLQSEDGEEARQVQASSCGDLRSAVAWVLVVLARQGAPERRASSASEREAGSTGGFPDLAADASSPAATQVPLAPLAPLAPLEPVASTDVRSPQGSSARRPKEQVSSWGLGSSFTGAFGLLPAPAFGPMLFGRYLPAVPWLPALQLSIQRLVTPGFESNGTSISMTRDAARLGAWVPLVGRVVDLGLAAEAGRLVASGSGSTLERGSSDSAFWFAFAVPLRFSIPLIGRTLQAELQLELDYSPVPYTFRYGSGDTLTSTAAFEGRGQVGITSLF
ncbi:MAG TPA: hypothetical protein VJV79_26860 [Polyangiaceae bacterium]|nr:hypothetical protein [Polyangiaceae bacterium]